MWGSAKDGCVVFFGYLAPVNEKYHRVYFDKVILVVHGDSAN